MLSIIIVSFNTCNILRECLKALFDNSPGGGLEVFVVDNDSRDGSANMVQEEFPVVNLLANDKNLGFAAANNQAFREATGKYIILLNPDAFVKPHAVEKAVAFMDQNSGCGICGGRLESPDGSLDPSARRFPTWLSKFFTLTGISSRFPASPFFNRHDFGGFAHDRPIEVDWVPGTFTILRKDMLSQIGYFDERFYIYYEETDLCLRAKKAGWKIYFTPEPEVIHIGGASSQTRKDESYDPNASQVQSFRMRSEWLYYRKNEGLLQVMANAGIEMGWHLLRLVVNFLPGRSYAREKRAYSASTVRVIIKSLRDTKWGSISPAVPW